MGIFDASSAVDVQFLNEVALVQSQVGEVGEYCDMLVGSCWTSCLCVCVVVFFVSW